jgi:hypothetical protein
VKQRMLRSRPRARVLLVMNTAFGEVENLPLDLKQNRTITYDAPEGDGLGRSEARAALAAKLEKAIRAILGDEEAEEASIPAPAP